MSCIGDNVAYLTHAFFGAGQYSRSERKKAVYRVAELRVLGSVLYSVTAVADVADMRVPEGTSSEELLGHFPATVEAALESGAIRTIADYAQQRVANLVKSGFVKGKGEGIDPVGQATRAV